VLESEKTLDVVFSVEKEEYQMVYLFRFIGVIDGGRVGWVREKL